MRSVPNMVGRKVEFIYHTDRRSVEVEKQWEKDGFFYINGLTWDSKVDGAYKTFKFVPEEVSGITIH